MLLVDLVDHLLIFSDLDTTRTFLSLWYLQTIRIVVLDVMARTISLAELLHFQVVQLLLQYD